MIQYQTADWNMGDCGLVGLNFTDEAIYVAFLKKNQKEQDPKACRKLALEEGVICDGWLQKPDRAYEILSEGMQGLSKSRIKITVSTTSVKNVPMLLPHKGRVMTMEKQIRDGLPIADDEVMDYVSGGIVKRDDTEYCMAEAFVAKRKLVEEYKSLLYRLKPGKISFGVQKTGVLNYLSRIGAGREHAVVLTAGNFVHIYAAEGEREYCEKKLYPCTARELPDAVKKALDCSGARYLHVFGEWGSLEIWENFQKQTGVVIETGEDGETSGNSMRAYMACCCDIGQTEGRR